MSKTVGAVIVCAGNASRMGGINKIFARVSGIPVIAYTLLNVQNAKTVSEIVIVTKQENNPRIMEIVKQYGITKPVRITSGGNTRAHSVYNGVKISESDFVAIMDGARPVTNPRDIDAVSELAFECGGAALGVKMTDTVKKTDGNGRIITTVDRADLVRIQTPQTFDRVKYLHFAAKALETDFEFTDDCSIYEHFGQEVKTVMATNENIKITEQKDLALFEKLVTPCAVRMGHGYDVHRLTEGRKLVLCGEQIDFKLGLLGHSDADVALHALMDAMLGAAALGDIGRLFPDTDDSFKDISSMLLLEKVAERVFENYAFGNCDVTIIAQKPKLLPHIPKMRENIAKVLKTSIENVNVKATTEEKLGFTGTLEGISSHAVCTLYKK